MVYMVFSLCGGRSKANIILLVDLINNHKLISLGVQRLLPLTFVVSLAAWIVANCDLESIKVLCSDFDNVGIAGSDYSCTRREFIFQSVSVS